MDTQLTESTISAATDAPAQQAEQRQGAKGKNGNGNSAEKRRQPSRGNARRQGPPAGMYMVHGTIGFRTMRIGDKRLATAFFKEWQKIHHALHYLTDFARSAVRGRIVGAANRGVADYIGQKTEEARHMLTTATELAESNGVNIGQHGSLREEVIEVACPADKKVMELVRYLDDYVIVVDSLWYEEVVDDKKRDDAHAEVVSMVATMGRLFDRMKARMIEYRRKQMTNALKRSEEDYARDLEMMVLNIGGIDIADKRRSETVEPAEKPTPAPRLQNKRGAQRASPQSTPSEHAVVAANPAEPALNGEPAVAMAAA